ncbi:MAG TPA: serine hydrolase domain-containing protein [Gemmatimonadales bacterium]|jgi:CubicO group peptidase (beta-lactamase class C family)
MNPLRAAAPLILAILSCPATAVAQAPVPIDTARIDSFVTANMASRHLIGVSVGLMTGGHAVFVRGYGTADLGTRRAVDTLTRFAVGSVTKEFTCAVILQLASEGKLSLDDKVAAWFPDLTRAGDIAVRDLMGHVSGYPDYYPLDFVDRRMLHRITADSLIHWYGRQPLDFEPGTRWSYSNTGFIMLGRIAERVGGKPIGELLRTRIFQPLGMRHSEYEPADEHDPRAQGYAWFAMGEPEPALPEASGWAASAGGIWSTPADLLLWDKALMEGRVVGGDWLRQMTTARRLANGASSGYGFGLSVGVAGGDTIWSHGGAVSGFAAQNTLVPSSQSAVVVLSNAESTVPSFPLLRMAVQIRPATRVIPRAPYRRRWPMPGRSPRSTAPRPSTRHARCCTSSKPARSTAASSATSSAGGSPTPRCMPRQPGWPHSASRPSRPSSPAPSAVGWKSPSRDSPSGRGRFRR